MLDDEEISRIDRLKFDEIQRELKDEFDLLEIELVAAQQENDRIRRAFKDAKRVEVIVEALEEKINTAKRELEGLTKRGYYGAARFHESLPGSVSELEDLTSLLEELGETMTKIRRNISRDVLLWEKIPNHIRDRRSSLEKAAHMKDFRYYAGFLLPGKITGRGLFDRIKYMHPMLIASLKSAKESRKYIHESIKISQVDFDRMQEASVLVNQIGSHIRSNIFVWNSDKTYGQWNARYHKELVLVGNALVELRDALHQLADDEEFVEVTGMRIKKVERREEDVLGDLTRYVRALISEMSSD